MHSPERRRALQASSPDDASSGLSHASTVFEDATSEWSVSEQSLAGSPGGRADVENEENRPPPSAAGNSQHTKTMASSSPAQKDPARLPPPPSASRPAFKPRAPSPRISAYAALLTAATPPQPKLRPRVSGGRVHLGPWTGPASPSGSSTPLSPSPTDRLRSPEDSGLAGAPTILRVLGSPLESEDSEASLKAWALPEPRAIDWASTAECVAGSGIAEDAPAGVPARLLRPQERPGRRKGSKVRRASLSDAELPYHFDVTRWTQRLFSDPAGDAFPFIPQLLASVVLPAATLVGASFMSGVSIESLLRSAASAAANVRGGTPLDTSSSVAPPPWGPRWPGALRRQTQKQVRAFETSSALSPRTVLSQHSAATAAAARANGSAAPQTPRREALMALAVCSIEPSEAAYQAALAQVSRVLAPAPAALAAPAPTEEKVAEEEVAVELKVTEEAAWSFGDDTLTAEEPEEEAAPPAAGGKAQGAEPEPAATEVEAAPLSAAEAVPAAAVRAPSTAVMVWQQEQTPAARRIEKAHEQPTTAATPETAAEDAPEAAEAAPAAVAATPAENEAPAAVVEVEVAAAEAAGEAVPEAAASSAELVDAAAAPQQPEQEQAEEGSDQRVAAPEESAAADAQSEPAPAGEEASAAPDATAMLAEATQQQEGAETAAAKVERSEAQPSSAQEAQAQSAAVSVDGVGADGAAQQAAAPASSPQQDHPLVMEEQLRATKRKAREAAWAEESVQKRKQQQDAERELAAAAWQATGSPRSAARRREEGATLRPTAQQEQHA